MKSDRAHRLAVALRLNVALLACLACGGCARDILFARGGEIHKLECTDDHALTLPSTENASPRWSPDGLKFAYFGRDASRPALFVADRSGGSVVNLTSGVVHEPSIDFVWSPDSEYLLYTATNSSGTQSIYRVRISPPGLPESLTPLDLNSKHPSVSPDSRRFVYASTSPSGPNEFDLYTSNIDGMNRTLLLATPNVDDTSPVWGPDDRIIYAQGIDLFITELDGTQSDVGSDSRTSLYPVADDHPAWSPNGEYIVYTGGSQKIYLIDSRPPHDVRCLACPAGPGLNLDQDPRWAGNGGIVFHRPVAHIPPVDSPTGLFIVNRDGTGERFLGPGDLRPRPDPRPRRLRLCLGR